MEQAKEFLVRILGQGGYSFLIRLLLAALVAVIGLLLLKLLLNIMRRALGHGKVDETLHPFLLSAVRILGLVLIVMTVLPILNVPISSFLATIGAAGVAVALALQNSLSNLAGGILILLTKPFLKGDFIDDLSVSGIVQEINMLYTTILSPDNKTITIPNGQLANSRIINYTKQDKRRIDLVFSISYQDDISHAKKILQEVVQNEPRCLEDPACIIGVNSYNTSSIDLDLKTWAMRTDLLQVTYALKEAVKQRFDEEDISIPLPQINVHLPKE